MVDCAANEWIPIISCVLQGSVLGPLLFILYTRKMFDLVENRLFANADDSTLLTAVRKLIIGGVFQLNTRCMVEIDSLEVRRCRRLQLNVG